MLLVKPFSEQIVHSNSSGYQINEPQEITPEEQMEVKSAVKEVLYSYGIYDENLFPTVAFENLPDAYWGLYHINNHTAKVDALRTNSIIGTVKHETVHAALAVLRQKIFLDDYALYKRKVVDGLISVLKNPPGGFFLTKDYRILRPDLSDNTLKEIKAVLLNPKLDLLRIKDVTKSLLDTGLRFIEADYLAHLVSHSLSSIKMTPAFSKSLESFKLTKKQLDIALRSIEERPKFYSTIEKHDYIHNPPQLNLFERWFTEKPKRMSDDAVSSQESKNESYKEYLENIEEILARLIQLTSYDTKDRLFDLVKIHRSRSNPARRLQLIETTECRIRSITNEQLKKQFELILQKLKENTLQEIKKTIVLENH